jgi:hypothetical protein
MQRWLGILGTTLDATRRGPRVRRPCAALAAQLYPAEPYRSFRSMRAELQNVADATKQSLGLLRRYL